MRRHEPSPEGLAQAKRVDALWTDARQRYGAGGPFLFGAFTAADAMYAPVVNRFHTYDVPRSPTAQAYMDAMMALPSWKEWEAASRAETCHREERGAIVFPFSRVREKEGSYRPP